MISQDAELWYRGFLRGSKSRGEVGSLSFVKARKVRKVI